MFAKNVVYMCHMAYRQTLVLLSFKRWNLPKVENVTARNKKKQSRQNSNNKPIGLLRDWEGWSELDVVLTLELPRFLGLNIPASHRNLVSLNKTSKPHEKKTPNKWETNVCPDASTPWCTPMNSGILSQSASTKPFPQCAEILSIREDLITSVKEGRIANLLHSIQNGPEIQRKPSIL